VKAKPKSYAHPKTVRAASQPAAPVAPTTAAAPAAAPAPTPAPAAAADDCANPFVLNAEGIRVPKRHCLR